MIRWRRVDGAPGGTQRGKKVGAREQPEEQGRPELRLESDLEIPVIPEDPEEITVRKGINERIQAEIHHEDKEAESRAEEMLEVPMERNEVPDLMIEDEDVRPATEVAVKWKIDEVAWAERINKISRL